MTAKRAGLHQTQTLCLPSPAQNLVQVQRHRTQPKGKSTHASATPRCLAPALVKRASIKSTRMNLAPRTFNVLQLKQSLEASLNSEQDTCRDLDTAKHKPQMVACQPEMEKDQMIKAHETMKGTVSHRTGTRATTTRAPPMNSAHTRLCAVIITGAPAPPNASVSRSLKGMTRQVRSHPPHQMQGTTHSS